MTALLLRTAAAVRVWLAVALAAGLPPVHIPAPVPSTVMVDIHSANPGGNIDRSECLTIALGDDAAYECGDLRVTYELPGVTTMNRHRAATMIYNSAWAQPLTTMAANVALQPGTVANRLHVISVFTMHGRSPVTLTRDTVWNPAASDGVPRRLVLSFNARLSGLPQGAYSVTTTVQALNSGALVDQGTDTSTVVVIDRVSGPFGTGWWIDGVEQISLATPDSSQRLWIAGDGSTRLYSAAGPGRWAVTPMLDRPDTLVATADGGYLRLLRDGAHVRFDATGRHTATVNRQGDSTAFLWSGSSLTYIAVPVATGAPVMAYWFIYSPTVYMNFSRPLFLMGNALMNAVTPNGAASFGGNPNLQPFTSIGVNGATTRFLSDASWRITARIGPLGDTTRFTYDEVGKLRQSTVVLSASGQPNIVRTFCPQESWRRATCPFGQDATGPYTLYDGPRTDVADTSRFYLTAYGAPDTAVDALGDRTIVTRDATFPLLAASEQQPNGHVTRATYNARGLIATHTDVAPYGGADAVTRYVWDNAVDEPDSIVGPTGEITTFGYDAHANRLWQEDGRGDSTRVSFAYDANNRVVSIHAPGASGSQLFTYDGRLGNLSSSTTPLGFTSTFGRDGLGRVITSSSPIDPTNPALQLVDSNSYDLFDRVISTTTSAPALSYWTWSVPGTAPAVARNVSTTYNAEGDVLSVMRSTVRGPGGMVVSRSWTYDAAHRVLSETDESHNPTFHTYDAAGNVVSTTTRRSNVIQMSYDALNRLSTRVTPAVVQDSSTCICFIDSDIFVFPTTIRYPYFGTTGADGSIDPRIVIPADTARFAYDANGNTLSADNRTAQVHRAYFPNGALHVDSMRVAVVDRVAMNIPDPYSLHTYVLNYAYDLSGRRISRTDGVPGFGGATQSYSYEPSSGMLTGTTDNVGGSVNSAAFRYDAAGRMVARTVGTGNLLVNTYDDDDRLVHRHVTSGSTLIFDDDLGYDARGKVTDATIASQLSGDFGELRQMRFDGMGTLVAMDRRRGSGEFTDEYVVDAFGNVQSRDSDRELQDWRHYDQMYAGEMLTNNTMTVQQVSTDGLQPTPARTEDLGFGYDASGNQTSSFTQGRVWINGSIPTQFRGTNDGTDWSRSYYDADERLRFFQRTGYDAGMTQSGFPLHTTFTEYRYDALGRRVLMRTQKDSTCGSAVADNLDCLATIDRFVWDGDQLLAELRTYAPFYDGGGALEQEFSFESSFTGSVRYVHAGGIDQPLLVIANGQTHVPNLSWRGSFESVSSPSGGAEESIYLPGVDREPYMAADVRLQPRQMTQWLGSLLQQQEDPSGLMYMRNRYYDPKAGRFTQQDPIGLAGGVNLYGFAGGDPVNSSDPFGLCIGDLPCPKGFVNAIAGFGDAASFGLSSLIRRLTPGGDGVDYGSTAYVGGALAGTAAVTAATAGLAAQATAAETGAAAERSAVGVGEYAGESIPARSTARDFSQGERAEINQFGRESGCHTCGTRNPGTKTGNFVPDHQPPSSLNPVGNPQRLFPQCIQCSREQGLAIARMLRTGGTP